MAIGLELICQLRTAVPVRVQRQRQELILAGTLKVSEQCQLALQAEGQMATSGINIKK